MRYFGAAEFPAHRPGHGHADKTAMADRSKGDEELRQESGELRHAGELLFTPYSSGLSSSSVDGIRCLMKIWAGKKTRQGCFRCRSTTSVSRTIASFSVLPISSIVSVTGERDYAERANDDSDNHRGLRSLCAFSNVFWCADTCLHFRGYRIPATLAARLVPSSTARAEDRQSCRR